MKLKPLHKYKTNCCKSKWIYKEKGYYVCEKCNKDVTLEIVYLVKLLDKDVSNP